MKKNMKKRRPREIRERQNKKRIRAVRRMRLLLAAAAALSAFLMIVSLFKKIPANVSQNTQAVIVPAEKGVVASEPFASEEGKGIVSTGISGVVEGICVTEMPDSPIRKIGSSYEAVIVGQRASRAMDVRAMSIGESIQASVANLNYVSQISASVSTIMSDEDYQTLLDIVEAEAGGEDMKSRILVANVILNRVKDEHFPDNVSEVVWERESGAAQFSPTEDGRIGTIEISEMTKEAVRQVLEGLDYSEGALFFVAKDQALESNVDWFEADLKLLFEHGDHAFYTFP